MSYKSTYTSTGIKLLRHPEVCKGILEQGIAKPISIQIAPTSRCNLRCVFCSNVNRAVHEDLDRQLLFDTIGSLAEKGAKTIEWTGGGDPTLYTGINEAIDYAHMLGLEQGLITNGKALARAISTHSLKCLTWVRVSMNVLDYEDEVEIPTEGIANLGFSYVWNERTTFDTLVKLNLYKDKYNPKYIRVVPNCQGTDAEQDENNRNLPQIVKVLGEPFFYQDKNFVTPHSCFWGYIKPFILHDGWVYPCSSVVLNTTSDRQFHSKFRWVRIEDLPSIYDHPMQAFPTGNCDHCVFAPQNEMMIELFTHNIMGNFV